MDNSFEESKAILLAPLAALLKSRSFRKEGLTWRSEYPDTIVVLDLQRSQFSRAYYVNLGVSFKALNPAERLKEYQCDIRRRLDTLVPEPSQWKAVLDFDSPMELETRAQELAWFVQEFGLPWFAQRATTDGARASFSDGDSGSLVSAQARAFLFPAGDV